MTETFLAGLRRAARLSQEDLAKIAGISQSMISRVEANPDAASLEAFVRISEALGLDPRQAVAFAATADDLAVIQPGTPYATLRRNLDLLTQMLETAAPPGADVARETLPTLADMRAVVRHFRRKPNVYLAGRSDAGKSRLGNAFLGAKVLPSFYTPATRITTIVRHSCDRPSWLREDVLFVSDNFELARWDDDAHLEECRLMVGSYDMLAQYASHKGQTSGECPHAAVVFVDSPMLQACNLIDVPGFQNSEEDSDRARAALPLMDVLLYLSPVTGFLDASDLAILGGLVKSLAPVEQQVSGAPKLSNLFVIMTHAAPHIADSEIADVLDVKAKVLAGYLAEYYRIDRRYGDAGLTEEDIRQRFFPFWYEMPHRREELRAALTESLAQIFPAYVSISADTTIRSFKERANQEYGRAIDRYEVLLRDLEKARAEFVLAKEAEPARRAALAQKRQKLESKIELYKRQIRTHFNEIWTVETSIAQVESFIEQSFDDRKTAKEYAFPRLMEHIGNRLSVVTLEKCQDLSLDIEDFLSDYERAAMQLPGAASGSVGIPFDVKGAFLGGLMGAAAAGALAVWAMALGNLAGYAVIATVVSWLSAIGISFSATSGVAGIVSLVASIGGPIVIGAVVVAAIALAGWMLLGDSWKLRLAKRIVKMLADNDVAASFDKGISTYWEDTKSAFEKAADALETSFIAYTDRLRSICEDPEGGATSLEGLLKELATLRHYFLGLPWKLLAPEVK